MPRKPPKYRRHPNGQSFVQHQGRRYYLGAYGSAKSQRRYAQFLERLTDPQAPHNQPPPSSDASIVELIAHYKHWAKTYYADDGRPTKEYGEMVSILRLLDAMFGDDPAYSFGPLKLTQMQERMIADGLARKVINQRINRIKRFFRWCGKKELVPQSLYHGLLCVDALKAGKCGAKETAPVRPVERSIVDSTLPWLSPVVAAMVRLQLLCGMRPGEVCRLRGCELNRRGAVWIYSPAKHKNAWRKKPRVIAIPPSAQAILTPFLKDDPAAYVFQPADSEEWRNENRAIHRNPDRKTKIYPSELAAREERKKQRRKAGASRVRPCYDAGSYRRSIEYAIKRANNAATTEDQKIPHWHPHQLRHTISTEIAQTIGQQAAQRWLGHASLDTTSIYTEIQISELAAIAAKLEDRWSAGQV